MKVLVYVWPSVELWGRQVAAVEPHGEDRRAAPVLLTAVVTRRAAAPIQPVAGRADHDVVLLMAAEGQAADEHAPFVQAAAAQPEALDPALLRDEQDAASPGETERCAQSAHEHTRRAGPAPDRHERAAGLGHVDPPVRPVGHRRGLVHAIREDLDAEACGHE